MLNCLDHENATLNEYRIAPLDNHDTIPHLRQLIESYGIPSGFVSERLRGVTHSFGIRQAKDGSTSKCF